MRKFRRIDLLKHSIALKRAVQLLYGNGYKQKELVKYLKIPRRTFQALFPKKLLNKPFFE